MLTTDLIPPIAAELRTQAALDRVQHKTLAELSGIPYSTLRRYLSGDRDIPVTSLIAICEALNVDPGLILQRATRRAEEDARPTKTDFALAAHEAPNLGAELKDRHDRAAETPEPFYDGDEPA
ncbi:MAG: helix-turn-helix transcriptional regulator [Dermabacter sp.]|nr:helix-turn-helix transcriptional regulator [Dermabacter sp.]